VDKSDTWKFANTKDERPDSSQTSPFLRAGRNNPALCCEVVFVVGFGLRKIKRRDFGGEK